MTAWLPPLMRLQDYSGKLSVYLEAIYDAFREGFVVHAAEFRKQKIGLKRYPILDGKEATFWHLVSEGEDESNRAPSMSRCERIRWPRAVIDHESDGQVKVWFNTRKGERRILLFLEAEGYLVVLADRGTYLLLWTAYPVERSHRRAKLIREYEEYKKKLESPPQ